MISRHWSTVSLALGVLLLPLCRSAEAQQPAKVPRMGWLSGSPLSAVSFRREAFRQGLGELGYIEGKNIVVDWRFSDGKPDRVSEFAAELVRLNVAVIVTAGPTPTRSAKQATKTIPIVMAQDGDPVGNGFVASLSRPGGNITGLSRLAPEMSAKQLELLREALPKLSHVAVFGTSTIPGHALSLREIGLAAGTLNIQLKYLDVLGPKDTETAFRAVSDGRANAILVLGGAVLGSEGTRILEFAVKKAATGNLHRTDNFRRWRSHVLWREHDKLDQARCHLRR